MRTKLVIWGTNAQEERVLLALELLPEKNEVSLHVFSQEVASDDFVKSMMDNWREDKEVVFPEHLTINRPLTIADSLLPEEYKVERGDVIQRAQSEWAFVVLSYKLQLAFRSELDTFNERIEALQEFSQPMWEELKGFWDKVQSQVKERNLFREHVESLREQSNELFGKMKKLRQSADAQFRKVSSDNATAFAEKLEAIHQKIQEGKHLINTFEGLKTLQREYHNLNLTRDDRNRLWERMDAAFKLIKEKRFGAKTSSGAAQDARSRIESRLKGLLDAIEKMAKSIERDEKDLHFESRRADTSGAQLEVQLRQAKIAMIQDRVNSKKEKLADMEKTRKELEGRIATIQRKIEEEEERLRVEQAKLQIKERIAREIEESGKELQEKAEDLNAAAREIAQTKGAKPEAPAAVSTAEVTPEVDTPADVTPEVESPVEVTTEDAAPAVETPAEEAPVEEAPGSTAAETPDADAGLAEAPEAAETPDNPASVEEPEAETITEEAEVKNTEEGA